MTSYLRVIGTGSSEIAPCIALHTEDTRCLFNCPEQVQSVLSEISMKLKTVKQVFVTRASWANIGGIPGLTLSRKNIYGISSPLLITGPKDLAQLPEFMKKFVQIDPVTMATNEFGQPTVFDDCPFTVTAVELIPAAIPVHLADDTAEEWLQVCKRARIDDVKTHSVVAYIIQLPTIRGKFDVEKARELGLVPGRQYSQLASGTPVTAPSGERIYPHQVMGADQVGPQVLILECPSSSHMSSLIAHHLLQSSHIHPSVIVHMTPRAIFEKEDYQRWKRSFDNTKHILLHSDFCPQEMALKSCFDVQLSLHLIDSSIFHVPRFPSSEKYSENVDCSIIGQNSLLFHLQPLSKLGTVECSPVKPSNLLVSDALEELTSNTDFMRRLKLYPSINTELTKLMNQTERKLLHPSTLASEIGKHAQRPKLTFLGTGSNCSSKYRNVSSILLHLTNGEFMILDAGQGTLGQIYKCFGPVVADEIMSNLKCVFVSHKHGDHHFGLIRILLKREQVLGHSTTDNRVLVIGPKVLGDWLNNYSQFCETVRFQFNESSHISSIPLTLQKMDFKGLTLVPVIHTREAYGVVLDHKDGWRLVYSGDTRPCHSLVEAGKGASLLIHEATFHHSLLEEAIAKRHSTNIEALQIAADMKAEYLILTHFSQRYAKDSSTMFGNLAPNVAIAFDFMTVELGNLKELNRLMQTIKDILPSIIL